MELGHQLVQAIRSNIGVSLATSRECIGAPKVSKVNKANKFGRTPLQVACMMNKEDQLVNLLAMDGIDVNVRSSTGWTPIMFAAAYCNAEALKVMLKDPRVDLEARNDSGKGLEELVGINKNCDGAAKYKFEEMIKKEKILRRLKTRGPNERPNVRQSRAENLKQRERALNESIQLRERELEIEQRERALNENIQLREREVSDLRQMALNLKQDIGKKALDTSPDQETDSVKVDLDTENDASSNLEAARGTLECPICMEMMKPPTRIWMCTSSHLVCEPCRDRLEGRQCPTCREEKVTLRAFMAENFARTLF